MIKRTSLLFALIWACIYIGCGDDSTSATIEEVSQVTSSSSNEIMDDQSSDSSKPSSSSVSSGETSSASEPVESGISSSILTLLPSEGDLFWEGGAAGAGGFTPYWYYDSTKFKPLDPSKPDGCFQVYQDSLIGNITSEFEEPLCVVKQAILGLVENLVNQGVVVEEAKTAAVRKLYEFFEIDSVPKNDSLYESALGYALSSLFPVNDSDTTMRVNFINDLANGKDFSKSDRCGLVVNSAMMIKVPNAYMGTSVRSVTSAIIGKLWKYCGGLTDCDESNKGEFRKYDCGPDFPNCIYQNREYICTGTGWTLPTTQDYETLGHECKMNNTRFPSDSTSGMEYICYEGTWYKSTDKLVGKLPKEYFFNENISYGTMEDSRDGHVYKTVEYDGLTWMAENINYYTETDSAIKNYSKCSQSIKCDYGRFYNVEAALSACPEGWRLPKKEELEKWIDMEYVVRQKFLPKLFSKLSGVRDASDEFGLSLLATITVDPYGWDETSGYGVFWVEGRSYIRITDNIIYFQDKIDPREAGEFIPVRCVK